MATAPLHPSDVTALPASVFVLVRAGADQAAGVISALYVVCDNLGIQHSQTRRTTIPAVLGESPEYEQYTVCAENGNSVLVATATRLPMGNDTKGNDTAYSIGVSLP